MQMHVFFWPLIQGDCTAGMVAFPLRPTDAKEF
jgi:hypothetical protein